MPKTFDWIDKRLGDARKDQPTVTDAVANSIKNLLNGHLSERSLSRMDRKNTAIALLAEMTTPATPRTESNHEN